MVKDVRNNNQKHSQNGILIAAMGIPGAGKSSTTRELASLLKGTAFCEPEEQKWPDAVRERDVCGHFTSFIWFRTQRVPQLYKAAQIAASGKIALVDCYFDKLFTKFIDDPSWHWLISPKDPYFMVVDKMVRLDYIHLPNVSVIIFLKVSKDIWSKFLKIRGRELDNIPGVRESITGQESMLRAAKEFCREKKAILIEYEQNMSSPEQAAKEIYNLLQKRIKNLSKK